LAARGTLDQYVLGVATAAGRSSGDCDRETPYNILEYLFGAVVAHPDTLTWTAWRQVGLAALPGCVENHRVNVDPTAAPSDQLNTNQAPISLKAVAPALQSGQRHRLVVGVQRQVEVTVQPGL
jgi:hypothetical protein